MIKTWLALTCFLFTSIIVHAQTARIRDNNTIGWWSNVTTIQIAKKWSAHLEYQWRREDWVKSWQQSLFRTGINYQLNNKVQLRAGYAYVETFNYGDIPLQAAGKPFPEHRSFQAITVTDKVNSLSLIHRFMLEQRWVGRYTNPTLSKSDAFTYLNRMRYMIRLQHPLGKKELIDHTPYVAMYDEILLGFGRNVGENIFDQNRLSFLLGYRLNGTIRAEAGYINQILEFGREIGGANVFQHNSGFILNTYLSIGKSK